MSGTLPAGHGSTPVTQGTLPRSRDILRLAAPLMVTNAIQSVLNLTDTWFLGQLSASAVAAMSAIYWIMSCAILLIGGVAQSSQTFVAQFVGARCYTRAANAAWNAIWFSLATFVPFVALAFAGHWILRPFHLDPTVQSLALDYWQPRMFGAAVGNAQWALLGFFNGVGATRLTLIIAVITTITNIPANQFFMFGLHMGMAGSAWGTNAAQCVGFAAALYFFLSHRYAGRYRSRLAWRPRWQVLRRQFRIGAPVGVMYGADILGLALFQLMIVKIGTAQAAATQIVVMLTSLAYMPTIGIASAGTTLVGQAIGRNDIDSARRIGNRVIRLCVAMMLSVAVLLLLSGRWVLPLFFADNDPQAAATSAIALSVLWFAAAYQGFDGLYFGSSFCMRAAGDTRVPALTALLLSWFVFVPLAHTLIFAPGHAWFDHLPQAGLGARGGWIALMCYAITLGTLMFLRWRSGRWQRIAALT